MNGAAVVKVPLSAVQLTRTPPGRWTAEIDGAYLSKAFGLEGQSRVLGTGHGPEMAIERLFFELAKLVDRGAP